MGKRIKTLIAAILLSFNSLFAVGCAGGASITGIRMSSEEVIDVPFGNFSFEGIKVTVMLDNGTNREIDLTEDMISDFERLKFFKMGEQDVNVVFRDTFSTTMKVNIVLNEFKDIYELVGYTCVYDGQPHEVKLNNELPEGATIDYPKGNIFTNTGEYEVIGVISKSGYATKTLSTTLKILENKHDEDSIVFADKTVPFNGEVQTIEAENVPEGVSVSYTLYDETETTQLNKAYNAGKYCFVAHFTNADPNYKQIEDKKAYLTITKIDYDLSEVKFLNHLKFYDGNSYVPSILNKDAVPHGLTVNYEVYNDKGTRVYDNSAAGVYTMKAIFTGGDINHNEIKPMEATLTVAKKIIYIKDTLDFGGIETTFTGNEIEVADPTGLPNGVIFSLDQNGFTYVGEYPVEATFTTIDPNETTDLDKMTVYALITPATTKARVFDGLDSYHDICLEDIDIDIDNNTATIDTDNLVLGDEFLTINCGIKVSEEEPITFKHITTDSETGDEIYVKVEPKDFAIGESYMFSVGFSLTNDDPEVQAKLNDSLNVSTVVGSFKYDYVKTKSGEYEYKGTFDAKNIRIDDGTASIIDVESGVTAKSIKFYDPSTSDEIPAVGLEVREAPYRYEVNFNKNESTIYVEESGEFVYKDMKTKVGDSEYVYPFSNKNLLISDGSASVIDTETLLHSITITNPLDESEVALSNLIVGNTYNYSLFFDGIPDIGSTPGTIFAKETGSFTYDRVKDLSTDEPITASNISIEANKASIINVDPSIVTNYIKFYNGATEISVNDLIPGESYRYAVSFRSSDTKVYRLETGNIRFGGSVMAKGVGGEYNVPFSLSNLLITKEDVADYDNIARVIDINPENKVRFIKIYDSNNEEVLNLNNLAFDSSYSYKVYFDNDNGSNWLTETGVFAYKRIKNKEGTAVFNSPSNLRFKNGEAYLIDVTEGLEVISIKIYEANTGKMEVTDLTTMVKNNFYYYRITIRSNNGRIYQEEMGNFPYTDAYIGT